MSIKKYLALALVVVTALTVVCSCSGKPQPDPNDILTKINNGEDIEINVDAPTFNSDNITKGDTSWVMLGEASSYSKARQDIDSMFNINTVTSHSGNTKNGCMYTVREGDKDIQSNNSTIHDAFRNKAFMRYWESDEIKTDFPKIVEDVYTDVTISDNFCKRALLNAYFNLFSNADGEDKYNKDQILTREQLYTMVYKSYRRVEELKKSGMIADYDNYYTPFVEGIADKGYLKVENGSLSKENLMKPITKLEAIWLITTAYFEDWMEQQNKESILESNTNVFGYEINKQFYELSGINLSTSGKKVEQNTLAYLIDRYGKGEGKGIPSDIGFVLLAAKNLGITNGIDVDNSMLKPVTKDEVIIMLLNTFEAENKKYGYLTNEEYGEVEEPYQYYDYEDTKEVAEFKASEILEDNTNCKFEYIIGEEGAETVYICYLDDECFIAVPDNKDLPIYAAYKSIDDTFLVYLPEHNVVTKSFVVEKLFNNSDDNYYYERALEYAFGEADKRVLGRFLFNVNTNAYKTEILDRYNEIEKFEPVENSEVDEALAKQEEAQKVYEKAYAQYEKDIKSGKKVEEPKLEEVVIPSSEVYELRLNFNPIIWYEEATIEPNEENGLNKAKKEIQKRVDIKDKTVNEKALRGVSMQVNFDNYNVYTDEECTIPFTGYPGEYDLEHNITLYLVEKEADVKDRSLVEWVGDAASAIETIIKENISEDFAYKKFTSHEGDRVIEIVNNADNTAYFVVMDTDNDVQYIAKSKETGTKVYKKPAE